ncbi:hypothetical protein JCM18909_197 [Cutibacterium acnes JCM 18909]|nr:hypothetical protein JCM18909_197 [Cutibacterium acnes JCM 18909]
MHAGAEIVAAPLGDDPVLASLAFERYCSAAMGWYHNPPTTPPHPPEFHSN